MKKKKMKKIFLIFILVIISIILIFLYLNKNTKNHNIFLNNDNYIESNYTDYSNYYENNKNKNIQDIIDFINYCKENSLDYMNIDFQLIKFYNNENFDLSNLERYIDYSKNHNQNDINTIITLVNNNVDNVINKLTEEEISIVEPMILNLIKEKYYIANNLSRYIDYYLKNYNSSSSQSLSSKDIINTINPNLEYGFYENSEATDITKDTLMIVNKHYKIDTNYEPSNLITIEPEYGYANKIRADIYEEFKKMYNAAKNDNVSLFIASPFRNYYEQKALYDSYVSRDGVKNADTYSARPGYSEHHTGLAVDLIPYRDLDLDTFESSAGFTWMQDNAYKYGFILRYPAGKEYITGYMYEPWHYRYVGVEAAKVIRNENITFEEYYEYYVKK